jgi:hypothetical protein
VRETGVAEEFVLKYTEKWQQEKAEELLRLAANSGNVDTRHVTCLLNALDACGLINREAY